jgi:hypothetical protein
VACFAGYALAFHVFVVGLGAFLRARAQSSMSARVLLFAILFGVSVGPWFLSGMLYLAAEHLGRDALLVASPSPFFAFVMLDAAGRSGGTSALAAGGAAAGFWVLVGLLLLASAGRRCREIIQKHETLLAETDRILAEEDAAAAAAHAQPEVTADAPPAAEEPAPETLPAGG